MASWLLHLVHLLPHGPAQVWSYPLWTLSDISALPLTGNKPPPPNLWAVTSFSFFFFFFFSFSLQPDFIFYDGNVLNTDLWLWIEAIFSELVKKKKSGGWAVMLHMVANTCNSSTLEDGESRVWGSYIAILLGTISTSFILVLYFSHHHCLLSFSCLVSQFFQIPSLYPSFGGGGKKEKKKQNKTKNLPVQFYSSLSYNVKALSKICITLPIPTQKRKHLHLIKDKKQLPGAFFKWTQFAVLETVLRLAKLLSQ